jgi:hypothetical protein
MSRTAIPMLALVLLLLAGVALAQGGDGAPAGPGSGYELSWWTVEGGGGTLTSAQGHTLKGAIGQPGAGLLAGGDYTLAGGFWGGGEPALIHPVYLPLVLRAS